MLARTLLRAFERKGSRPVMAKARGVITRDRPSIPAATVVTAGEPIYTGAELDLPEDMVRAIPVAVPPARSPVAHPSAANVRAARTPQYEEENVEIDSGGEDGAEEEDAHAVSAEGQGHITYPPRAAKPPASAAPASAAPKSKEAYRFLLDHIDAEIAALQRRHSAVTTRRQTLEERTSHRVKELFEFMESPWTLLSAEEQPALPATGIDVYLKEQRAKKHVAGASGKAALDANDKMFVLACHKNYRSLPSPQKKPYEEAACYNAAVRQELKYRLATGCARFEAFCEQIKECTADMARAGQVPEVPPTWHHAGVRRHPGGGQWSRNARHSPVPAPAAAPEDTSSADAAVHHDDTPPPRKQNGRAPKKTSAAKKVKAAATAAAAAAAAPSDSPPSKEPKRKKPKAPQKEAKQKPTPKKAKAARATRRSTGSAKATSSNSSSERSASIPLPDLNRLAIKKLKRAVASTKRPKKAPAAKNKGSSGKRSGASKKKK